MLEKIQSKACIGVIQRERNADGCGPAGLHARRLSLSRLDACSLGERRGLRVIKEFRRGLVLSGYPRRDSGGNGVGKTGWSPRGSTAKNACNQQPKEGEEEEEGEVGGRSKGRRRRRRNGRRRRRIRRASLLNIPI